MRLTRNGEINHAAVLNEQDVKDLWSDPLLRYSNVLDGLFHDAVVLCESDSDFRYYQAVLDVPARNSRKTMTENRQSAVFKYSLLIVAAKRGYPPLLTH